MMKINLSKAFFERVSQFKLITFLGIICIAGGAVLWSAFAGEGTIYAPLLATTRLPLEMTFVGDVMFGRYKESGLDRNPETVDRPFDAVRSLIESDIAVVNLETALLREPPAMSPWGARLRFAAGVWAADALEAAGFTAASLANNHSYDMKYTGLRNTRELLREREITPIGVARESDNGVNVVTLSVNGWQVGFIGFSSVLNSLDLADDPTTPYVPYYRDVPEMLRTTIETARPTLHLVVVIAHWGRSEADVPEWDRREASRRLIDIGADVVIGHHPHRLQGIERYKNGVIAHSLGDFLFDKLRMPNHLSGVLRLRYLPGQRQPEKVMFHPVVITRTGSNIRPVPASGGSARMVYQRLQSLSAPYNTNWIYDRRSYFEMQNTN